MDGYSIVSEAIHINEISKSYITKIAGRRLVKNLTKDPIFYSGVATELMPVPWGIGSASALHIARNPKSKQAIKILAKKYNVNPNFVKDLMARRIAKRAAKKSAGGLGQMLQRGGSFAAA